MYSQSSSGAQSQQSSDHHADRDGQPERSQQSNASYRSFQGSEARAEGPALPTESAYNAARLLKLLLDCKVSERGMTRLLQLLTSEDFSTEGLPMHSRGLKQLANQFVAAQTGSRSAAETQETRSEPASHFELEGICTASVITVHTRSVKHVLSERLRSLTSANIVRGYERTTDATGQR